MDAAVRLFIAQGYADTSLSEISREAGVTKRAIYDLIGDKEALFREVFKALCAKWGSIQFERDMDVMSLREILTELGHTLVRSALNPRGVAFARVVTIASPTFPDLVNEMMELGMKIVNGFIADIFSDLVRQGRIAPVDPIEAGDIFYDAILGNRPRRALVGYKEAPQTDAQLAIRVEMFLSGYLKYDETQGAVARSRAPAVAPVR